MGGTVLHFSSLSRGDHYHHQFTCFKPRFISFWFHISFLFLLQYTSLDNRVHEPVAVQAHYSMGYRSADLSDTAYGTMYGVHKRANKH